MQDIPAMTQEILVFNLARMNTIHTRIKQLRESLQLSMEQLAALVGVSWQTVQQWENGKTAPKRLRLEAVANALQTTSDHLLLGTSSELKTAKTVDLETTPGLVAIRKVEFRISAGIAGFAVDFKDDGDGVPLFMPQSWADAKKLDPAKLYATRTSGDSMSPGILDHDVVVVNTGDTKREKDTVFAFNHEGEFTVKRVKHEFRRWWLFSDNPDQKSYPPIECSDSTFLLGRIVHLHRDM
ncbi:helix-turn-helix domain-containing protein [Schauerella aestuarii]|uniref:helix-turn-helix domain-containing protein n=1 Tax=Schauerella aestuarii TaxID=2511204 RepID=UPI001367E9B7|nr:XRE family transcriptional regulator [Achromobacter aestuarii]MYZ41396.1 LexA family transcriptional regulator [Achromobacter aestuarii]